MNWVDWITGETVLIEPIDVMDLYYLPSRVAKLIGHPVERAEVLYNVGRVWQLAVEPVYYPDPTLLVCNELDMSVYSHAWGSLWAGQWRAVSAQERAVIVDNVTRYTLGQRANLTAEEWKFISDELCKFRNDVQRWRHSA